jgi:hypothetical protein
MTRSAPSDLSELRDAVGMPRAVEEPVEAVGGGSNRGLGRPFQLAHKFDLWLLSRILP